MTKKNVEVNLWIAISERRKCLCHHNISISFSEHCVFIESPMNTDSDENLEKETGIKEIKDENHCFC